MPKLPAQLLRQKAENAKYDEKLKNLATKRTEGTLIDFVRNNDDSSPADSSGVSETSPPSGDHPPGASGESASQQQELPLAQVQPQAAPQAAPQAPPQAPVPEDPNSETWQQRYRVLDGKYRAEVPQLSSDLAAARAQIEELSKQVQAIKDQPAPAPVQPAAPTSPVSKRDVEEYGEDMIDLFTRIAENVATTRSPKQTKEVSDLTAQVEALSKQIESLNASQTVSHEQMMRSYLDANVPGWAEQDKDPKFSGWLSQFDPLSGYRRSDLLATAYQQGDTARVAHIFKLYQQENETLLNAATQVRGNGSAQSRTPAMNIESMVTPTPAAGAEQPAPVQQAPTPQAVVESRDIKRYYTDKSLGRYKSNPELAQQIEQEILAATREGRVRQ